MASTRAVIVLMAVVALITVAEGGHRAPAPAPDCSSVLFSMADCLSFVENGSKDTKPTASCCSGLKTVLAESPSCLCEVLKSSASFGISLNTTRALLLPKACSVAAPPITACGGSAAVTPAPVASPPQSKPSPPAAPPASTPAPPASTPTRHPSPAPAPPPPPPPLPQPTTPTQQPSPTPETPPTPSGAAAATSFTVSSMLLFSLAAIVVVSYH